MTRRMEGGAALAAAAALAGCGGAGSSSTRASAPSSTPSPTATPTASVATFRHDVGVDLTGIEQVLTRYLAAGCPVAVAVTADTCSPVLESLRSATNTLDTDLRHDAGAPNVGPELALTQTALQEVQGAVHAVDVAAKPADSDIPPLRQGFVDALMAVNAAGQQLGVAAAPVPAAPTPVPVETVSQRGGGQLNTDPFQLAGGSYTTEYTLGGSCFYGARLEPAPSGVGGDGLFSVDGPRQGSNRVYGVKSGSYFVDMITGPAPGCPWTVTIRAAP